MGDEEQIPLVFLHRLLDPLPALNVQVVGGLVQHQQIDLFVHQHTQAQTALLAAGQGGYRLEHILAPEFERRQPVPRRLGSAVLGVDQGVHQAALRVVKVDVLRQVSNLYSRPHPDLTAVWRLLAQDHFQQRGLAAAVVSDQGDALAAGHFQPQAGKEGAPAEALGEALDGQHLVPAELPLSEADLHLPLLFGAVGDPHPLDALLHGFDPLKGLVHSGIGPHPHLLCGLLQLLDLGLLLLVLLQLLLIAALLLHGVEAVTALVKFRPALLDLDDAVHHLVQKITVVGDGEHRPLELAQILLQPLGGPQVQVVRRLIQQQDVGVLQDQTGQVHPGLFPAGQAFKQLLPHGLWDGQSVAHFVNPGVRLIASGRLIGRRELVIPGHQGRVRARGHLPG